MNFFLTPMDLSSANDQSYEGTFVDRLGRHFTVEPQDDDNLVLRFIATNVSIKQTAEHFHAQAYKTVQPGQETEEAA